MAKSVTYSKELREWAKVQGKLLVTVDVPGMTMQLMVTNEQATRIAKVAVEILGEVKRK